ncbi:MAG: hypothetical protein IKD24_06295 [Alistipes sp.]|nr:hypothetical protein [Alistipes sp.]
MEMYKYILQILKTQPIVVFSWGFHNAQALPNGLRFAVNGYLHQGLVDVVYNEGADLFIVNTLDGNGTIKQQVEDVYLDCLVNVIDSMVETI